MSWVKRIECLPYHSCDLPFDECRTGTVGFGSVWRCDECGQHHVYDEDKMLIPGWWRCDEDGRKEQRCQCCEGTGVRKPC